MLTTIVERLTSVIAALKEEPGLASTLTPSSGLLSEDISLDSLEFIQLVLMIEDEFEVELDFDSFDLHTTSTVGALAGVIERLTKDAAVSTA